MPAPMLRTLAVLALVFGGCRDLRHVTVKPAATEPAFLGDASGIYRSIVVQGPLPLQNLTFHVIEVDKYLIALFDFGNGRLQISFVSQNKTTAVTRVVGTIEGHAIVTELPSVPIAVSPGAMHIELTPDLVRPFFGGQLPPGTCDAGSCFIDLQKECDYDSTYSGVFNVLSVCGEQELAKEQWIVSITSGGDGVTVVLDDAGAPRLAESFDFNLGTHKVLAKQVHAFSDKNTRVEDIAFTIDGTNVTLEAKVAANTEARNVCATRRKGARAGGITCGSRSAFNCPTDVSGCPTLPPGMSADFVVKSEARESVLGQLTCPIPTSCEARFSTRQLCDRESRAVAANGCGMNRVTLELADDTSNTGSGSGEAPKCVKLSCDQTRPCSDSLQKGSLPGGVCGFGNHVSLFGAKDCAKVECRQDDERCPPLLDCEAINTFAVSVLNPNTSCVSRYCSYGQRSFGALGAVTQGEYAVTGFHDDGTPIVATVTSGPRCNPLALPLPIITCPPEAPLLSTHACLPPTPENNLPLEVAVSGETGILCLHPLLDGRAPLDEIPTQCGSLSPCCRGLRPGGVPDLVCLKSDGSALRIVLTPGSNGPSGTTGYAEVTVRETDAPGNEVTVSAVGTPSLSVMPFRWSTPSNVLLTLTSGEGCYFSGTSSGANALPKGAGVQATTVALNNPDPIIDILVSCP